MSKIAVLLRVYDRLEDLKINLDLIQALWKNNEYYTIVVSNGKSNGYLCSSEIQEKVEVLVELDENAGHIHGNSQLLIEGVPHIPDDCLYTLILEADTWLLNDEIISKYTKKMQEQDLFWSSSEWVEKYGSLALDFALINTQKLKECYHELFAFTNKPERYIVDYLQKNKLRYCYIQELMPVHRPSSLKYIYIYIYMHTMLIYGGRFRIFPRAPMLTHHIEDLEQGIQTKKQLANLYAQTELFDLPKLATFPYKFYNIFHRLSAYAPRSAWFKKVKK